MLTKNYQNIANGTGVGGSYSIGIIPVENVVDITGTTRSGTVFSKTGSSSYQWYSAFFAQSLMFNYKLYEGGVQHNNISGEPFVNFCNKSTPINENDVLFETTVGVNSTTVTDGLVYATILNNGSSDITVNTLQLAHNYIVSSFYYKILIAEWDLGTITIPAGESKTWRIGPVYNTIENT